MLLRLTVSKRRRTMKKLLAIIAVSTAVAAPAIAQAASHAHTRAYQNQTPMVNMYGAEHYQIRPSQEDVNPDFQLGGNRS
jgi:hypothetical protein